MTRDARVAEWARGGLRIAPRMTYAPIVLGPSEVPPMDTSSVMAELAVLSALAHGAERDDPAALRFVFELVQRIPDESKADGYLDLLFLILGDRMVRAVEDLMTSREPLSEIFRKHYREGRAEAILDVLAARSLTPTPVEKETILSCRNTTLLQRWLTQALTANSVAEVLTQD